MGFISVFDIDKIKEKYDLNIFLETGTYMGGSLTHIKKFGFLKILSVELIKEIYDKCKIKFINDENIFLYNGNSFDKIKEMLDQVKTTDNILFWLDAHLPSHYSVDEYDIDLEIPLEKELKNIISNRDISKDYFIIDDLRIYEDGSYAAGNWLDRKLYNTDGIQFIYDLFSKTHNIKKDYRNEGYIICEPK